MYFIYNKLEKCSLICTDDHYCSDEMTVFLPVFAASEKCSAVL